MDIEIIENKEAWDSLVNNSPNSLLFHKWDFLKIAEDYSGFKLFTYGVHNGEGLLGIFPIFCKKVRGLEIALSPPPGTGIPYLGPAMSSEYEKMGQNKKEHFMSFLAESIDAEMKKRSTVYFNASLVPNLIDARPFGWKGYMLKPDYTYVVDLNKTTDEIWAGFHKDLRRDIRQSEKLGLMFQGSDDISSFYKLLEGRYEEQNLSSPLINEKYIEDLFKYFADNIKLYQIYDEAGEVLSSSTTVEFKDRVMGWMGITRAENNVNDLLIWNLIKEAKQRGFAEFEIQGAGIERLCQFKSKFNPRVEMNLAVKKGNRLGRAAEWMYMNLYRNYSLNRIIKSINL